jgi:hydrogenase-4 component B
MRYGKSRYELQDVWTCGSIHTTAMQYTATSYSHPLLRIFQSVFGLKQSVKVEGEYEYYPKKISHEIDIAARVGDNVYKPSIGIMVEAFKKIRRVQNGNLQWYLSYIVAALAITLLCAGRW